MLLEIELFKNEEKGKKIKKKTKIASVWAIPIPISTTKDVICCSNGPNEPMNPCPEWIHQFV